MHLTCLDAVLADATAAPPVAGAPVAPPPPQSSPLSFFVPLVLMLVILYFMMIRPQSQQRKRQQQLIESLKSGDKVVTASGIVGTVISVKEKTLSLRSMDAKMEVTKSSVTDILERGGEEKAPA